MNYFLNFILCALALPLAIEAMQRYRTTGLSPQYIVVGPSPHPKPVRIADIIENPLSRLRGRTVARPSGANRPMTIGLRFGGGNRWSAPESEPEPRILQGPDAHFDSFYQLDQG